MTNWQVIKMSESSNRLALPHLLSPLSNLNQLVHFEFNSFDFSIYFCLRFTIKLFSFAIGNVVYGIATIRNRSRRAMWVENVATVRTRLTTRYTTLAAHIKMSIKIQRTGMNDSFSLHMCFSIEINQLHGSCIKLNVSSLIHFFAAENHKLFIHLFEWKHENMKWTWLMLKRFKSPKKIGECPKFALLISHAHYIGENNSQFLLTKDHSYPSGSSGWFFPFFLENCTCSYSK